jgi:hypothetical protein
MHADMKSILKDTGRLRRRSCNDRDPTELDFNRRARRLLNPRTSAVAFRAVTGSPGSRGSARRRRPP